ncbi:MAG: hypothetical protein EXR72_23265 [Myxococcales bacterium]|nr:hypothetical protein [Myxococcales bacterium]
MKGLAQTQPIVQAARIEAALLWFFYRSMTSEVWTCSFDDITDCDSAAGYYRQINPREMPVGLARYVAALGPEAHNRIYDALLAERCWRDIDKMLPAQQKYLNFYTLALSRSTRRRCAGWASSCAIGSARSPARAARRSRRTSSS